MASSSDNDNSRKNRTPSRESAIPTQSDITVNDDSDEDWGSVSAPLVPAAEEERVDPQRAALLAGFSNKELIYQFLKNIGEQPDREGLKRTPYRVERAWEFIAQGYHQTPEDFLNNAVFESDADEMVLVKDIQFYSMCEHHLLPFTGVAHVAYLPNKRIVGLSKLPRIVDMFARRLQVQERLTLQIARCVEEVLQPRGVGVVLEAVHFCMMMRGVQKQHSKTVTSAMLGGFREDLRTREEFLRLISSGSRVV
jgi:GTP cyclohydrolase I